MAISRNWDRKFAKNDGLCVTQCAFGLQIADFACRFWDLIKVIEICHITSLLLRHPVDENELLNRIQCTKWSSNDKSLSVLGACCPIDKGNKAFLLNSQTISANTRYMIQFSFCLCWFCFRCTFDRGSCYFSKSPCYIVSEFFWEGENP